MQCMERWLWLASPYCTSNSFHFIGGISGASVIRPTVASSNPHIPWNILFLSIPNTLFETRIPYHMKMHSKCDMGVEHLQFYFGGGIWNYQTIIFTVLHLKWVNLHQGTYFTWAIQPFISPLLRGAHAAGQPELDLDPTYFQLGSGFGNEPKFEFCARLIFELGSTTHTCLQM